MPLIGDAIRLEQVFVNLLNNAAKYTPPNGRIHLHGFADEETLSIVITDNGIGISEELLPQIFDLFSQGQLSLDRSEGGLGIGLTVVKSLVEMHGGTVTMLSDGLHKGASVKVTLPRATGSAAVPAELAVPSILSFHGVRVLVVDDHEDAAQAMSRLLARRGCEVRIAHDGPAGFSVAQQFKPDVLLLDLGLPRINGYDLARQLRMNAGTSDALFIAVSGYAQENDREIALKAGFDQHFPKPVDMHALSTAILNRMNERRKAGTSNVAV
jgi:CheY-like chemotaxis protein